MKPLLVYSVIVKGSTVPPEAEEIINHNRELCRRNNTGFILFTPENNTGLPPAYFTDHFRNDIGACTPHAVYTDWDCRLLSLPDFPEQNKTYWGFNRSNDTLDNFLFYTGDCQYLRELQRRTESRKDLRGIFYEYLNNDRGALLQYPPESYIHKGLGKGRN